MKKSPRAAPHARAKPKRAAARPSPAKTSSARPARKQRVASQRAGEQTAMQVRFWGVRGSLASAGPHTERIGGNTSCVEVRCGDELIIFDCGTGLRALGMSLAEKGATRASIFVSHYHWDHIAGLPFFAPAYDPHSQLTIYGATRMGKDVRQLLSGQMVDPYFPVDLGVFNARLQFVPIEDGGRTTLGAVTLQAAELCHPGGSLGYRLEFGGRVLVYATDFEHGTEADDRLVELARNADLLIFDAQFTPDEYDAKGARSRRGWGHSTYEAGATLAQRAGVKQLALFHHAPERDDAAVEEISRLARRTHKKTIAASEGLSIDL